MCVYVRPCMYSSVCICMCAYMYMCLCAYVYMYVWMYTCVYVSICVCLCVYVCMCECICVKIYICACICLLKYTRFNKNMFGTMYEHFLWNVSYVWWSSGIVLLSAQVCCKWNFHVRNSTFSFQICQFGNKCWTFLIFLTVWFSSLLLTRAQGPSNVTYATLWSATKAKCFLQNAACIESHERRQS